MSHTPTCPSKPAESSSSIAPRVVTSRQHTVFVCPLSVIVEPLSAFHSRMVPSSWPEMRNSHSGECIRHESSERFSCSVERHAMSYL